MSTWGGKQFNGQVQTKKIYVEALAHLLVTQGPHNPLKRQHPF